jgi:hypothetical protein
MSVRLTIPYIQNEGLDVRRQPADNIFKSVVLLLVKPCILPGGYLRFGEISCLHFLGSSVKMEIAYLSDVSVSVYEATRYCIQKTTILAVMAMNTSTLPTDFAF